ncbi:MAG: YybH family protein [Telluria sp.]
MKRFLAAAMALGMLAFAPQYAVAQNADSKQQIEQVIETFRLAIINKDKDAFLKLFLKEDITWAGVTSDASVDRMYATRPNPALKRPAKIFNSNPRKFIDSIVADKAKIEETISNVRIDSDTDVGQVWFDYSFKSGDYKENWGKESWQMVRTEAGWKIAAVTWSQEFNPTPPPKASAP